ncbi:tRNA-His guanylyltransferase [Coniosporium apollinis]|uniref:tRNA(His) guanylyltransferase n=1 Tax=Coniosporium apollinis TaxID=61459 RepID=A0ABQ9P338_9PEZI|nr:tRNA-His guanylyltransferase [Coniosporium apollinis]
MGCFKPFIVLLAFLSAGVLALPAPDHPWTDRKGDDHRESGYGKDCLTDSEARFLVDTYNYFFVRLDPQVAEKYLAPDFHEFSDSYITLFMNGSKPLGSPVSASRDEFIQNHFVENPFYPEGSPNWFRIEEIFHSCTKIGFRWVLPPEGQLPVSMGPLPIRGDDLMYTAKRDGKWVITAEWSEFNTLAWAQNIGICAVETNVYEYVRAFEQSDVLLPNTWIVVRIDGRGFKKYGFRKPNDDRGIGLMNAAAQGVMRELQDLVIGYGVSDEYSFVFHKDCTLFERRASKLTTTIVSIFTAYYVQLWPACFPETPLSMPLPSFDGRAVMYPSVRNLRDYLSWRQVDCHINNLYNTTFWALIQQGGMDAVKAEEELMGTSAADKNEILFSRFGINYNNKPEVYKKGSVILREVRYIGLSPQLD